MDSLNELDWMNCELLMIAHGLESIGSEDKNHSYTNIQYTTNSHDFWFCLLLPDDICVGYNVYIVAVSVLES